MPGKGFWLVIWLCWLVIWLCWLATVLAVCWGVGSLLRKIP